MEQRDDKLGAAIEEAQRKAITDQQWASHQTIHDLLIENGRREWEHRWSAHDREHEAEHQALEAAIASADKQRELLRDAHAKEHELEADARDKAAVSVDKRLEGMNEVRAQLKDQAATFARTEVVDALTDRVIAIEKLDIKGEGRSLGQGAVIGAIIAAIGVAATIVSLVVVLANAASGS